MENVVDDPLTSALACLDAYMDGLNSGDEAATNAACHFPHVRLAGGKVAVWQRSGDYRLADFRARAGDGPSLIECLTYRHSGHSRADPAKYRPEGELEKWKERDPIKIYRERLKQFGVSEDIIVAIEEYAKRRVDEATEKCKAAPPPSAEILTTDVYADGGFAWRN